MTVNTITRMLLAVALGSAVFCTSALAAGEPKSQAPFTLPAGAERSATATVTPTHSSRYSVGVTTADAKGQLPFTGSLGLGATARALILPTAGDSKNQLPFTRR
jgi:hypothetical protein